MFAHFDLPNIDSARFLTTLDLTANISRMKKDIDKHYTVFSTVLHSTLNAENLVDLGSLTTKLCLLIPTYRTSIVRTFSDNFGL